MKRFFTTHMEFTAWTSARMYPCEKDRLEIR